MLFIKPAKLVSPALSILPLMESTIIVTLIRVADLCIDIKYATKS